MNSAIQNLANECLDHLEREETHVQTLTRLFADLRAFVISRESDNLAKLVDQHSNITRETEAIETERNRIRDQIARQFRLDANHATISVVISQCDESIRAPLEATRARLRASSTQLNERLVANANLTRKLIQMNEQIFQALAGDQVQASGYERSGRRRVA